MEPWEFVKFWIWLNEALEVDVIALFNIIRIEGGTHFQRNDWHICEKRGKRLQFSVTVEAFMRCRCINWSECLYRREKILNGFHYSHFCSNITMFMMKSHILWIEDKLTMHNKPPFILNCTVGYEWILCATSQIFSIIINYWDECENAQGLIVGLRKLLIKGKHLKIWPIILEIFSYIFGHAFNLSRAFPPCQRSLRTWTGTLTLHIVTLLSRHKFLSRCDMHCYWLHCTFSRWGLWKEVEVAAREEGSKKFEFCSNE